MRRILLAALVAAVLPATVAVAAEPVTIGFVIDGPWPGNDWIRQLTIGEVLTLTEGEFEIEFPDRTTLVGDWSLETVDRLLEQLLTDPEVDVVVTWGLLASHAACCEREFAKPVIAPVVVDQELQGFPLVAGASGVTNLSYVSLPDTLGGELAYFQQMVPFRRVAILVSAPLLEAIPELPRRTREQLGTSDLEVEYVPVGTSVEEALTAISEDTDAVYVWPLFHVPRPEYQRLIDGINRRGLASFSALGGEDLELGILASLGSDEFLPRLARRVALNLQRILLGEEPASLPVEFLTRDRLRINMETARRIGVSPTWQTLLEADLLHAEAVEELETRTLRSAVGEAVRLNLDVAARQRVVASGEQEVARSRSVFEPQLDLAAVGLAIDEDRAVASFGSQAERQVAASVSLSQLLFSEQALANAAVQRRLQDGRRADLEALRLDVALAAATGYLDLLRAKSLVQVQRNNLRLTRSNLELATIRRSVGAANPAEVYRWESQIATDRKALIEAMGRQQVLEIQLNRVMHRPLGSRFSTREVGITDPDLLTGHDRFAGYTETPRRYETFTEFVVEAGLAASPELEEIDAVTMAQQRLVESARRAFWAPTLGLEAAYEEIVERSGAGSEGPSGLRLFNFPTLDDTTWSVGLRATLPLFRGGARTADRLAAEIELERLALERSAVAERIEQRIRSAMASAWASFPGIELTRRAAAAAQSNLDLVADAYARGAVSIIELLDAQNAALNADEQATNAVYDFLIDLMEVERASGCFHLLMTAEESSRWFDRLDAFFDIRGVDRQRVAVPEPMPDE